MHSQMITLADDSGIVVDALDGAPGVYSARFAGENADDAQNNAKLLTLLKSIPYEKRTARFVCSVALVFPSGESHIFEGVCEGYILPTAEGNKGFGYDPLFFSADLQKSFGVADNFEKNLISHRSRAIRKACDFLQSLK